MLQIIFMTFINSQSFVEERIKKTAMVFPNPLFDIHFSFFLSLRLTKFVFIALNINLIETLE